MTDTRDQLAREAKAFVALAFRNGPIENIHAGYPCPTCANEHGYSRISDSEMKVIMKSAVNRMYTLLRLKATDPTGFENLLAFSALYVKRWDEPEEISALEF